MRQCSGTDAAPAVCYDKVMLRGKPAIALLAVLALLFYGAAPALALLAPRAPASANGAALSCLCHPGRACCCAHGSPGGACGMNRGTCHPGQEVAGALWTVVHPLGLLSRALPGVPSSTTTARGDSRFAPRCALAGPLTPPPQLRFTR